MRSNYGQIFKQSQICECEGTLSNTNIHASRQNSSAPPNALCMVCSLLCLPHQLPTTNYHDPPDLAFFLPLHIYLPRMRLLPRKRRSCLCHGFLSRDYYVSVIFLWAHTKWAFAYYMKILRFTNCKNVCATSTFQLVLSSTSCLSACRSLSVRHLLDHSQPDTTTACT